MSEARISVVINTYNARQHLAKVLESVKDFDEVVVCDMESTDDTVSIAEQYGCKVVTFPKANHTCCEPARTFAIQSASSKWAFVVDADEIVTPELREELYKIIQQPNHVYEHVCARLPLRLSTALPGARRYRMASLHPFTAQGAWTCGEVEGQE